MAIPSLIDLNNPASPSINQAHAKTEAFRLAKLQVREDIKAQGLRLKDYEAKEITRLSERWFFEHRAELLGFATIELLFSRRSVRIPMRNRTLRPTAAHSAEETQS